MTDSAPDPRHPALLAQAFESFTAASTRLEEAYARLEAEVGSLQAALATTRAERDTARAAARDGELEATERQRKLDHVLSRHQRLAAMGEMAATLAHQIRTPLSAALLYAGNAANPALPGPRRDELLARSIDCLHDLEQLVSDMLGFARGAAASDTPVALADIASATRNAALALVRPGQSLDIAQPPGDVTLCGNREALVGALLNLVTNALQAGGRDAWVRVEFALVGTCAEIRVTDNGPGVAPALRQKVFDPFFTSRPEGTGLGLAVVRSVAQAHGGDVRIEQHQPRGACFLLRLPLATALGRIAAPDSTPTTASQETAAA